MDLASVITVADLIEYLSEQPPEYEVYDIDGMTICEPMSPMPD